MESLPEEMLVEIFRRTDGPSRLIVAVISRTFRKIVLRLVVPITSVFVLERICKEGDLLSLVQSDYRPVHHSEAIYYAFEYQHPGAINWLLNKGYSDWESCLLAACEFGTREQVDFFLEKLDLRSLSMGSTHPIVLAMGAAARGGHLELVQHLESLGGQDWVGVLEGAAYSGNEDLFDLALSRSAIVNFDRALERACRGGQLLMVEQLIDLGADSKDAFSCACEKDHRQIVDLFLNKGYDPDWGLEAACRGRQHEVVKYLIKRGATNWNRGLKGACAGGDPQLIELMLEKGATGFTRAFHAAVETDELAAALLMLEKGAVADWNHVLAHAVRRQNSTLIKMAFDHGATELNVALSDACCFDVKPMVKMLIEKGATKCECERPMEKHL